MTSSLQKEPVDSHKAKSKLPVIAIAGNPNAGKTTLFNALTGLRAKTSNFPGTTIECRTSRTKFGEEAVELLDLPGLYSLNDCSDEERLARDALTGQVEETEKPPVPRKPNPGVELARGGGPDDDGLGRPR